MSIAGLELFEERAGYTKTEMLERQTNPTAAHPPTCVSYLWPPNNTPRPSLRPIASSPFGWAHFVFRTNTKYKYTKTPTLPRLFSVTPAMHPRPLVLRGGGVVLPSPLIFRPLRNAKRTFFNQPSELPGNS